MKIHYYVEDENAVIGKVEGMMSLDELFEYFQFDHGRMEEYQDMTHVFRNTNKEETGIEGDFVVYFGEESISFSIGSAIPMKDFDQAAESIKLAITRAKRIKEKCVTPEMKVLNFD